MLSELVSEVRVLAGLCKKFSETGNPKHPEFVIAGRIALLELATALELYSVSRDVESLHKQFIFAGLDFVSRWERWLTTAVFQKGATKVFHEFLLRFVKGCLKAYRGWRIDITK